MDLLEHVREGSVFVVHRLHYLVDCVDVLAQDLISLEHYFLFFFVEHKSELGEDVTYALLHLLAVLEELIPELSNLLIGLLVLSLFLLDLLNHSLELQYIEMTQKLGTLDLMTGYDFRMVWTSWFLWTPWITHSGQIQSVWQSKQKYEIGSSGCSTQ
jgi:hypothetical protein